MRYSKRNNMDDKSIKAELKNLVHRVKENKLKGYYKDYLYCFSRSSGCDCLDCGNCMEIILGGKKWHLCTHRELDYGIK